MVMHTCQIGQTNPALPCLGLPHHACVGVREECFEAGDFSAPIFHCLLACVDGATKLSLFGFQAQVLVAAISLQSRPAWIVFFFCCWVANGKHGGRMVRFGIGCWVAVTIGHLCHSHAISILWCCQIDKGSHLVPLGFKPIPEYATLDSRVNDQGRICDFIY